MILWTQAFSTEVKKEMRTQDPPVASSETPPTTLGQVNSDGECSSFVLHNPSDSQNIPPVTIPEPTWTETPSIVKIANDT
ncbi:hypothetical protein ABFA07_018467 [Porites harrisoni]